MIDNAVSRLGDAVRRLGDAIGPHEAIEGWATVDLERAESEVPLARSHASPDDELLGARCRRLELPDGHTWLLLEPSTEGRLAASLARFGEGPVALYLRSLPSAAGAAGPADPADGARAAGFQLSSEANGPLGPERLVLGGSRWGPYLLLVSPATIDP